MGRCPRSEAKSTLERNAETAGCRRRVYVESTLGKEKAHTLKERQDPRGGKAKKCQRQSPRAKRDDGFVATFFEPCPNLPDRSPKSVVDDRQVEAPPIAGGLPVGIWPMAWETECAGLAESRSSSTSSHDFQAIAVDPWTAARRIAGAEKQWGCPWMVVESRAAELTLVMMGWALP